MCLGFCVCILPLTVLFFIFIFAFTFYLASQRTANIAATEGEEQPDHLIFIFSPDFNSQDFPRFNNSSLWTLSNQAN